MVSDATCKSVELNDYQIDLIIRILREKRDDLDVVLKNQDGLEIETVHELQMDHREINSVMRELQFYTVMK